MLIDDLKSIVGARGWTTDAAALEPHLTEWRGLLRGATSIMILPKSTAEVAAVVRACADAGVSVVPQGGNTGLCGGAIPDSSGEQVLLSMARMNRVRRIDAADFSVTVEAGCILAEVQKAVAREGRLLPLSLASEGSCQIGGNLSTNAGGINVLRYGTAREQVLGLEVVLADGSVWDGLRSLRKDTAGYDLKQLFIGSEGTLGVITAAVLRLFPQPGELATALVALPTADSAVGLLDRVRSSFNDQIQAFELIGARGLRFVARHITDGELPFESEHPWYVLLDIDTNGDTGVVEELLGEALESGAVTDVILAKSAREAELFWRLRHSISEAQKFEGASVKHDVSVPVARIGEFLHRAEALTDEQLPDARPVIFGHVGDGNLHYNVSRPRHGTDAAFREAAGDFTDRLYDLVGEFRGSISAEHGIGQLKRDALQRHRNAVELDLMRTLKNALDPRNTLNPGKVI